MITIVKNTELGLETLEALTAGCWINVIDPTPAEAARLPQDLGVPADFVTYPLDMDERARTEKENGALLIVLRVPHYRGAGADVPYSTIPLGIILTDQYIVTICKGPSTVLRDLLGGRVRTLSTGKRNRFVLHLLLLIANQYLTYLREINRTTDQLEDQLQQSSRNREVLEMLKHQKSLVYFTTGLKANKLVLLRLQRSRLFEMYPEDEDLLEDALTETQQAIEMTNVSSNILAGMMDAFASIISNNLNGVMKFLASITIVLSIPSIVAGFYGMNVDLPLQEHALAFPLALGVAVGLMALVIYVFWKKDWF
jgi:magnesium transporter